MPASCVCWANPGCLVRIRSMSASPAPAGTSIVNRFLPLTWTGSVTVSCAAASGEADGKGS